MSDETDDPDDPADVYIGFAMTDALVLVGRLVVRTVSPDAAFMKTATEILGVPTTSDCGCRKRQPSGG